jgi:DNA-directed RNA polymerase subunit N (RpoN/RPB10)
MIKKHLDELGLEQYCRKGLKAKRDTLESTDE